MPDCIVHTFVTGLGMFGDAMTCVKCGYSKYPESLGLWDRCVHRRLPETAENLKAANDAMRRREGRDAEAS
jgi:hypothetical protein